MASAQLGSGSDKTRSCGGVHIPAPQTWEPSHTVQRSDSGELAGRLAANLADMPMSRLFSASASARKGKAASQNALGSFLKVSTLISLSVTMRLVPQVVPPSHSVGGDSSH